GGEVRQLAEVEVGAVQVVQLHDIRADGGRQHAAARSGVAEDLASGRPVDERARRSDEAGGPGGTPSPSTLEPLDEPPDAAALPDAGDALAPGRDPADEQHGFVTGGAVAVVQSPRDVLGAAAA